MPQLSKNRIRLLTLFYKNPEQPLYIQQIGRLLRLKPGIFQRTLNKMTDEGILLSEYKANARYFRINRGYAMYKELKSIVTKQAGMRKNA